MSTKNIDADAFFIRKMDTNAQQDNSKPAKSSTDGVDFVFIGDGEALVEVEDRAYLCTAGHLLLIPGETPFSILHYAGTTGYSGSFSAAILQDERKMAMLQQPLQQAFWFDDGSFMGELMNMLLISMKRKDEVFIRKGLDLLLSRVKVSPDTVMPRQVEIFLGELFNGGNPPASIDRYAEAAGISGNYLSRLVKQATGKTVGAWIDIYRLNRAKTLLKETVSPIIDIAQAIGLEDQSYFSRFFRQHLGLTPSEYRKMMQG